MQSAGVNEAAAQASDAVGSIFLTLFIAGVISSIAVIIVMSFIAKKVQIYQASTGKAFLAEFLTYLTVVPCTVLLGGLLGFPWMAAIVIALVFLPVLIIKMVFTASWGQGFIVWLCTFIVRCIVWWGLTIAGFVKIASDLNGGAPPA